MTTEPHPALRAVPSDDAHGSTLATRWEPQHQFVGALLWHDAAHAATLLDWVPLNALRDPLTRWTAEVIADLLAEGRDPHPSAVLHQARTRAARGALHPDRAPSPRDHHRFATHLADLYTSVLDPTAAADHARDVLDDAYRSAVAAAGQHLQELAETATGAEELATTLDAVHARLDDLRRRAAAIRR